MDQYERAAREAGWRTTDFGYYLECKIAYDDLKESVQHYVDGRALIEIVDGFNPWEAACEVSGISLPMENENA